MGTIEKQRGKKMRDIWNLGRIESEVLSIVSRISGVPRNQIDACDSLIWYTLMEDDYTNLRRLDDNDLLMIKREAEQLFDIELDVVPVKSIALFSRYVKLVMENLEEEEDIKLNQGAIK